MSFPFGRRAAWAALLLGLGACANEGGGSSPEPDAAAREDAGARGGEDRGGPVLSFDAGGTLAPDGAALPGPDAPHGPDAARAETPSDARAPLDALATPPDGGADGRPPGGRRTVFLAQGHRGRTTISCDDGRTWIHNRSQDDNARCFVNGLDCDHDEYAGRGIAFGDGWFVVTWGWGRPGTVQRSRDGVTWETVLTGTPTFADVAFGNGAFAANGEPTRLSADGKTWEMGGRLDIKMNYRSIDFVPHDGGRFLVTGESMERAIVWSRDGKTWTKATERPDACVSQYQGAAYGAGVVVLASGKGHICHSRDGGNRWELVPLGPSLSSPVVWTGTEFLVWGGSTVYSSPDGVTWKAESIQPAGVNIGAVARGATGTLVAANAGWMTWYEKQRFFRSTDGRRWTVLDPAAYVGSHPIHFIEAGEISEAGACDRK